MGVREIKIVACRHTKDSIFLECRELDITVKADSLIEALNELVELLRLREAVNLGDWLDRNWPFDRYNNQDE